MLLLAMAGGNFPISSLGRVPGVCVHESVPFGDDLGTGSVLKTRI